MADQVLLLAVGLSAGLLLLLLIGVSAYLVWGRLSQGTCQGLISTITPFPASTVPVLLISQGCRSRPDEVPFFLLPSFGPQGLACRGSNGERDEEKADGRRDILAKRGSLTVRSWYPIGTVKAALYCVPTLNKMVAPLPGVVAQVCFSVEYRHGNEQLLVSLLQVANLPAHCHSKVALAELRLLPDDRRPRQAKARGKGHNPSFNDSFVFQVSGLLVSQSTLSICVLSVDQRGKRQAVGRALLPLEGELGQTGRVLWRDLETDEDTQGSDLGDIKLSMNYSPLLQCLNVGVLRARGLHLLTDTGVYAQVGLQIHTQTVKSKQSSVVKSGDPYFNHRMTFKLRPQQLDEACLSLELQQPNTISSEPSVVLGVVVLGPFMYARGAQLQHWMDMINTPQELIKKWHRLSRPQSTLY